MPFITRPTNGACVDMSQNANLPDGCDIDEIDPAENACPFCGEPMPRGYCRDCAREQGAD